MKRTVAFILTIVLVLSLSAAMFSVAADYTPSPEHPDVSETETQVVTETEAETEAPKKSGCRSAISGGILLAVLPAAFMLIRHKKED